MGSKCRKGLGPAITAVLFVMTAATNGCQQPTQVAAKSPTPVHLVDVTLYPSSEDLTLLRRFALLGFRSAVRGSELVVQVRRICDGDQAGHGRRRTASGHRSRRLCCPGHNSRADSTSGFEE